MEGYCMRRFNQYSSALKVLSKAGDQDLSNEFIQSGIVDKFSLQFELRWKLLKDLLRYEGDSASLAGSPREILKAAYGCFDFVNEDAWLSMLRDRNSVAHVYDAEAMTNLIERILNDYIAVFTDLREAILRRYGNTLESID